MALKKIGLEKNYPDWKVRKYRILKQCFSNSEFVNTVILIKDKVSASSQDIDWVVFTLLQYYSLPLGLLEPLKLYYQKVGDKAPKPEALLELIKREPVGYMNLKQKVAGQYNGIGENEAFLRLQEISKNDLFAYLQNFTLILIPPNTPKDEIGDFLDKNYKKNLKPLLSQQLRTNFSLNITSERVRDISDTEIQVAMMRLKRVPYKEIANFYLDRYTEEELRHIYLRYKNRFRAPQSA